MPQAFEAINLKTRWSPFLKSLLPLVLSQFKNWVLPESESRMLYLSEVGATEPGKLNIEGFSASRSFNYIESLSGIETGILGACALECLTFNYIESLSGIETA